MRTLLLALAFVAAARTAHADDRREQAKRDVAAGLAAQAAGKYDEAIADYTRAYDVVPHPEILFDLAQAYRLKGDVDKAYDNYMKYLAAEPNGRVSKEAARWAGDIEKQIAARKAEPPKKEPAEPPKKEPAEPPKKEPAEPPHPIEAAKPPPPPKRSPPPIAVTTTPPPAPPPHHSRRAAWLVAGTAVAAGGAALGFDLWGNSTYDSAVKETDPNRQVSLWHDANTRRYTADALAIGSVGCAAVAVWLFLRSGDEPSTIASIGAHDFTITWTRAW